MGIVWFGIEFWFGAEGEGRRHTEMTGLGSQASNTKGFRLVAVAFVVIGLLAVFGEATRD
jgi:hypothetical protein